MNDWIDRFLESGAIITTWQGKLLIGCGHCTRANTPFTQGISFSFPDFFLSDCPFMQFAKTLELSYTEFSAAIFERVLQTQQPANAWQGADPEFFQRQCRHLKSKFSSGTLIKAVPFVMETANLPLSRQQLLRSLLAASHYLKTGKGFLYGFWNEREGMVGVSPELLFHAMRKEHLEVSTVACAGTSDTARTSEEFLSDPKERQEHQLVIEGIIESLSPYGPVTVGTIELQKFGSLSHLLTPICASLDAKLSFIDLLHALHPTPALGAFPKKEGMEWLKHYQSFIDRKRYGAPVGYLKDSNEALFYVAIRNVQWDTQAKYIAAGCGVVAKSEVDKEWREIQLKIKTIKEMLQI